MKPAQPLSAMGVYKRRIQGLIKGQSSQHRAEPLTRTCYIVYFTTVALLVTLCMMAVLR